MSDPRPSSDSADSAVPDAAPGAFEVRVEPGGDRFEARCDESLLQAALRAGVSLASSCRAGSCRSCIARLVAGRIEYRIAWPGLSAQEKAEGLVLPCVALPRSDLVLDVSARPAHWL